jgi:hypothetical protein
MPIPMPFLDRSNSGCKTGGKANRSNRDRSSPISTTRVTDRKRRKRRKRTIMKNRKCLR